MIRSFQIYHYILLTKTTAAQNEAALSYHRVRGLHFLAVIIFATTILPISLHSNCIPI